MPMEWESTTAQGLHITQLSARYDAACKRVLSEKSILAWIMKSCLEEYQDCDIRDIAEKYISLIINVEAQNDYYPGYPLITRGVYYCCRMISSQYGREFTGPDYGKLKKVYSIWICMNPPKNKENTITRYRLVEEHLVGEAVEPVGNYDLLSIVMLCLGDPEAEGKESALRMLDVLFSNETSVAEKKKILAEEYDIPMTQKLDQEVSSMCNLSEGVLRKGLTRGMAQGMAQGRVEGRAEGLAEGILSSIQSLMKNLNVSVERAMTILDIPEGERQAWGRSSLPLLTTTAPVPTRPGFWTA